MGPWPRGLLGKPAQKAPRNLPPLSKSALCSQWFLSPLSADGREGRDELQAEQERRVAATAGPAITAGSPGEAPAQRRPPSPQLPVAP